MSDNVTTNGGSVAVIPDPASPGEGSKERLGAIEESARASAAAAAEGQAQVAASLADAQAKLTEIAATATQAVAARTAITDAQAVIATKSDHIQKAQEHADKVRADLDRALTAATKQATEAEGLQGRAQSAADGTTALLAEVRATKAATETDAGAVAAARQAAEESAAATKGLADKAAAVESRVADYEKHLAELEAQCASQLKTIESLLPGATGAGLAHSFDERRKGFLKPQNRWQVVFIASVLAVVGVAATGLYHQIFHLPTAPTFEELVRLWMGRFPMAGALLWLALHASREAALAKRLEEDYGYKAAIASSLEGFQKQMSQYGKDVESNSPLGRLLNDTLATIAAPPGRIYDKHKLVVSPMDELKRVTEAAKALKLP
jgi:hypothetical protein